VGQVVPHLYASAPAIAASSRQGSFHRLKAGTKEKTEEGKSLCGSAGSSWLYYVICYLTNI
ncbi:MAG: hypothetical protein KA780_11375, partial [Prolixibacteraceae bacterium]|nr:hypothetical protein [Prolixibacteraceae bacterium]